MWDNSANSGIGTKRTSRDVRSLVAIGGGKRTWRPPAPTSEFDPKGESSGLLDDFIRECEHRGRDVEAKSLGSRERR